MGPINISTRLQLSKTQYKETKEAVSELLKSTDLYPQEEKRLCKVAIKLLSLCDAAKTGRKQRGTETCQIRVHKHVRHEL